MSNDFDKRLDWKIREDLFRLADEIEVPPIEEQKAKFRQKYLYGAASHSEQDQPDNTVSKSRRFLRSRWGFVAAVLLLAIISLTMYQPKTADALGKHLLEQIKVFLGGTMYNVNDTWTRETPQVDAPPIGLEVVTQEIETTLEEVRNNPYFISAEPTYLPEGAILEKVFKANNESKATLMIKFVYNSQNSELVFVQSNYARDNSNSAFADEDDAVVKKILLNGSEAQIITLKDGKLSVRWELRGLDLRLTGSLNEDELIKIAAGVK